jgi:hypothetical protein
VPVPATPAALRPWGPGIRAAADHLAPLDDSPDDAIEDLAQDLLLRLWERGQQTGLRPVSLASSLLRLRRSLGESEVEIRPQVSRARHEA